MHATHGGLLRARGAWMWAVVLLGVVGTVAWPTPPSGAPVRVAAAANLTGAFQEMGAAFEKRTGKRVSITFGATDPLSETLVRGAPFDMFAAANESAADDAIRAGVCDKRTRAIYAQGRLAVWTRKSISRESLSLADLVRPKFTKIAIPDPERAPYGRAARQAATMLGVWPALRHRIVYGKDAWETLELAKRGKVDAAIVPLSLAMAAAGGTFAPVDEALHSAITQALVVCTRGRNAEGGRQFAAFVRSAEGRAILRRFGYTAPDGT